MLGVRRASPPTRHPQAEQQLLHDSGERKRLENRVHGNVIEGQNTNRPPCLLPHRAFPKARCLGWPPRRWQNLVRSARRARSPRGPAQAFDGPALQRRLARTGLKAKGHGRRPSPAPLPPEPIRRALGQARFGIQRFALVLEANDLAHQQLVGLLLHGNSEAAGGQNALHELASCPSW